MGDLPYDRIEIGQPPFYNTKWLLWTYSHEAIKENKINNGKNETVGSTVHLSKCTSCAPWDTLGPNNRFFYDIKINKFLFSNLWKTGSKIIAHEDTVATIIC